MRSKRIVFPQQIGAELERFETVLIGAKDVAVVVWRYGPGGTKHMVAALQGRRELEELAPNILRRLHPRRPRLRAVQ